MQRDLYVWNIKGKKSPKYNYQLRDLPWIYTSSIEGGIRIVCPMNDQEFNYFNSYLLFKNKGGFDYYHFKLTDSFSENTNLKDSIVFKAVTRKARVYNWEK